MNRVGSSQNLWQAQRVLIDLLAIHCNVLIMLQILFKLMANFFHLLLRPDIRLDQKPDLSENGTYLATLAPGAVAPEFNIRPKPGAVHSLLLSKTRKTAARRQHFYHC